MKVSHTNIQLRTQSNCSTIEHSHQLSPTRKSNKATNDTLQFITLKENQLLASVHMYHSINSWALYFICFPFLRHVPHYLMNFNFRTLCILCYPFPRYVQPLCIVHHLLPLFQSMYIITQLFCVGLSNPTPDSRLTTSYLNLSKVCLTLSTHTNSWQENPYLSHASTHNHNTYTSYASTKRTNHSHIQIDPRKYSPHLSQHFSTHIRESIN